LRIIQKVNVSNKKLDKTNEISFNELRIDFASRMSGLILDCGSGEGVYHSYLKGNVVSLDVDIEALHKSKGQRARASVHRLPFKDEVFDSLWACAIIEHVTEECIPELWGAPQLENIAEYMKENMRNIWRNQIYSNIKKFLSFTSDCRTQFYFILER